MCDIYWDGFRTSFAVVFATRHFELNLFGTGTHGWWRRLEWLRFES
ncbi:predicted protein [Sclerotinia sclerotiorum 1980 UF-70]|uniref:Uncharacterized protein n=1 Tax=Sclerotinia sclerotiorum (strain ATCC 18683 / 1980 / Ss-1) TaxID=665079 RepID=A7EZI9_SCLS1|nr:predicted protein [Sclerotinia sclerotiorum 1980 UF-70]EDN94881.1 predicted protein [Sclerotinia sclerotiorum 1980 UF-70]